MDGAWSVIIVLVAVVWLMESLIYGIKIGTITTLVVFAIFCLLAWLFAIFGIIAEVITLVVLGSVLFYLYRKLH